jgi:1-aminocyclopropane-1-carboxylate deaminase
LAIKAAKKSLTERTLDLICCCSVGTGGTIAGIINSLPHQKVLGFPALKGFF